MPGAMGENRHGAAPADEEKGIKVQTELSVHSTDGGEGGGAAAEERGERNQVAYGFPMQRPPPGFQRTYA